MISGFDYLFSRGITEDTIREFGLMYYSEGELHALPGKFPKEFFSYAKSLVAPVPPETVSKFKDCVLIPVLDLYNTYATIFARRLIGTPKFDALPFNKKSLLFGLNQSHPYILNKEEVYIVEGVFDFLVLWQYGIRNVVCPLGCSLAYEQMCLLARFTKNFTVIFDPDEGGQEGMVKAKAMLRKYDYKCRSVYMPEGLDIDDFIIKYGVERFLKHAKNTPALQANTGFE